MKDLDSRYMFWRDEVEEPVPPEIVRQNREAGNWWFIHEVLKPRFPNLTEDTYKIITFLYDIKCELGYQINKWRHILFGIEPDYWTEAPYDSYMYYD